MFGFGFNTSRRSNDDNHNTDHGDDHDTPDSNSSTTSSATNSSNSGGEDHLTSSITMNAGQGVPSTTTTTTTTSPLHIMDLPPPRSIREKRHRRRSQPRQQPQQSLSWSFMSPSKPTESYGDDEDDDNVDRNNNNNHYYHQHSSYSRAYHSVDDDTSSPDDDDDDDEPMPSRPSSTVPLSSVRKNGGRQYRHSHSGSSSGNRRHENLSSSLSSRRRPSDQTPIDYDPSSSFVYHAQNSFNADSGNERMTNTVFSPISSINYNKLRSNSSTTMLSTPDTIATTPSSSSTSSSSSSSSSSASSGTTPLSSGSLSTPSYSSMLPRMNSSATLSNNNNNNPNNKKRRYLTNRSLNVAAMFCIMVVISLVGTIMLTNEAANSIFLGSSSSSFSWTYWIVEDNSVGASDGVENNGDRMKSNLVVVIEQHDDDPRHNKNSKNKKKRIGSKLKLSKSKSSSVTDYDNDGDEHKHKKTFISDYASAVALMGGDKLKPPPPSSSKTNAAGLRGKMVQGRWEGGTKKTDKHTTAVTVNTDKLAVHPSKTNKDSTGTSKTTDSDEDKKAKGLNEDKGPVGGTTKSTKQTASTSSTSTKTSTSQRRQSTLKMNLPSPIPPLPYNYEKIDPRMYDNRISRNRGSKKDVKLTSSSSRNSTSESTPPRPFPRIFSFDPNAAHASSSASSSSTSSNAAPPKKLKIYPADFTDNTQLYGVLPSDDERLSRMEIRAPYSDGECVPMQDWQTTYHPSCNAMHELGMDEIGDDNHNVDATLFGTGGFWRYAWRLDLGLPINEGTEQSQSTMKDTVVLKTLKYEHNFEDAHFEHDRVDAVAMERLTASPHVINVFGFCGHSVITEYADGLRVGALADKARKTPLERLRIARDVANGLADVHGIDGDGNATFVHLDVNPANVVSIGGTLKLNDFNIGIIRRWNTTSNEACGFPAQYPNPQWRSPEEARQEQNLTEKVDIFSLGHIFFRLICGHEPWNKLEPGGKPSKEEINRKVQKGITPFIPEDIKTSVDPEIVAIRDAMMDCYAYEPSDRPAARDIARSLDRTLKELTSKMKPLMTNPPAVPSTSTTTTTTKKLKKKKSSATTPVKKGTAKPKTSKPKATTPKSTVKTKKI